MVKLNPIQAGVPSPYRLLPFCAEMVDGKLMKLSDLYHNYIGHHLKYFLVNSYQGRFHGNTFAKKVGFHQKLSFSSSICIHIGFFSKNAKPAP